MNLLFIRGSLRFVCIKKRNCCVQFVVDIMTYVVMATMGTLLKVLLQLFFVSRRIERKRIYLKI